MRDLDTGRETTVYKHECTEYRPIDIVGDRILFGSNYPQDPVSRSTIHAGSLAFGYEIEIDRDPIDPRFYRTNGFIAHGRIFAVASNGIIRVWDTVLLDHLHTMNQQQATLVLDVLEKILAKRSQNKHEIKRAKTDAELSPVICWQLIAEIFDQPNH